MKKANVRMGLLAGYREDNRRGYRRQRGYRDGFTKEQFLARQILKMQEELGETVFFVHSEEMRGLEDYFIELADFCRDSFDNVERWKSDPARLSGTSSIKGELADMQVVLFNMAAAVSEITSQPFDVVQAAVDKAKKDVKRGVR